MRFPAEELDDEGDLLPIVPAQGDHEECRDSFETSIHDSITPAPPPIYNRHTLRLGVAFLMLGFLTTSIGTYQIFVCPLLCPGGTQTWSLSREFFYGFTLWSGFLLTCSGSLGVRTAITKRQTTLHRYLVVQTLTSLVLLASVGIMINAVNRLTTANSCLLVGHALSAAILVIDTVAQIYTICFTYETIFDGKTVTLVGFIIESTRNTCCPQLNDEVQMTEQRNEPRLQLQSQSED